MKIKSKRLPIIMGCLGVLAVSSIGFATWLVGYENKKVDNDISVTIDTFEDKGCILECIPTASDKKINLGDFETSSPETSKKPIKVDTTTADLTVGLDSFKLAVSDGYKTKPTKIKFEIKLNEGLLSAATHNVKEGDLFGRTSGSKTFLDFSHQEEILLNTIANPDTTIEGWTIYDFKANSGFNDGIKFQYGSLYKKGETSSSQISPATFYNENTPDYNENATIESQKDTLAKWALATEELEALNNTFKDGAIKISITVE